MSGHFAQICGQRPTILEALVLFTAESTVCGSARTMTMLMAERSIQGVGDGGIQSLANIITADLVPLSQRGLFTAIIGMTFSVCAIIGPFIAGALTQDATWHWLFYMNLPLYGVSMVLVLLFLQLRTPTENFWTKLSRMDWIGNALIIGST
ncbi:MFS general substrate transporter [Obba rivulosa]|uniref:MFS general substrate transporter n=1 Tax=Obba rivulosa TaxID=1052685 RepID=A0A8E2AJ44_9APHY|nr:MFS general substrate transporter [Obba rivulosa]